MKTFTCNDCVIFITPLPGVMLNEMRKKPMLRLLQKRKRK